MKTGIVRIVICFWGMLFLCATSVLSQIQLSQEYVEELRGALIERLKMDSSHTFPPAIFSTQLVSNAKYENDTIWMGNPQSDFHTEDDVISILFHEHFHYLCEKEGPLPVKRDSNQKVVQWITNEFYEYTPGQNEIEDGLAAYQKELNAKEPPLDDDQITHLVSQMKVALSQSQRLPFNYAPSNLAREEIQAYHMQRNGEQLGLYILSPEAKASIQRRLTQLDSTFRRRQKYEYRHDLNPDGGKKKRSKNNEQGFKNKEIMSIPD